MSLPISHLSDPNKEALCSDHSFLSFSSVYVYGACLTTSTLIANQLRPSPSAWGQIPAGPVRRASTVSTVRKMARHVECAGRRRRNQIAAERLLIIATSDASCGMQASEVTTRRATGGANLKLVNLRQRLIGIRLLTS